MDACAKQHSVTRGLRIALVCVAAAGVAGLALWSISCSPAKPEAGSAASPATSGTGKGEGTPTAAGGEAPAPQEPPSDILVPCIVGDPAFPVFVMHFQPGMPPPLAPGQRYEEYHVSIIMAAFADGRVIWSGNRARGGPPYYRARVTPQRIAEVRAQAAGYADPKDQALTRAWFALDSSSTTLSLCWSRNDSMQMQSWHDYIEAENPSVVVIAGGEEESLAGKTVQGILAQGPGDYRRFRQVWADWKKTFFSLIPDKGEKADGLEFEKRWYDYSNGSAQPLPQGERAH